VTNSAFINVFISTSKDRTENLLSIIPEQDYDGEAIVTLHVEDGDHNFAIETFKVTMIPKPDIPTVNIMSPTNNAVISGTIEITGSAYDAENGLERVEVKIGNEPWQPVAGLEYWSIEWDSMEYTLNMDNIEIRARAIDLDSSYSVYDSIYIQILNIKIDSDSDGVSDIYDACPYDPLNWLDSDGDGVGDNSDHFIDDSTQWADRDGDGFGDNPSGNSYDKFPYDPTQWQDSDGDGLGDNPEGNNPDPNPKNPSQVTKSDDEIEYRIFTVENGPWLGLGLLIIVNILIFIYIINIFIKRKKENKIKSDEKSN
jgi:hypothetical protein